MKGCGGWSAVMDDKVSNPPPNKYIYEFSEKLMHRQNENIPKDSETRKIAYKPMYPKRELKKHPKGLCVPCCFKNPAKGTNVSIAGTEGFHKRVIHLNQDYGRN